MRRSIEDHRGPLFVVPFFLAVLLATPSCQNPQRLNVTPLPLPADPKSPIQEGEVTLQDGDETNVLYPKPYESPPRLTLVEFKQAESYKKPFAMSDFEIVEQDAKFFRIQNNHPERGVRSWATLKWRAEGTLAAKKPAPAGLKEAAQKTKTPQEQWIERVRKAGGVVELDPPAPGGLIVNIDLHGTAITDADLAPLEEMRSLRVLNLYGTAITDAGVQHLHDLTSLRVLNLNGTRITDAGVQHLRNLTNLNQLALSETHLTDAGLVHLQGLTNLNELTLGGKQITDAGLTQLKGLRNLKHLTLVQTSVTPAGLREFSKAMPAVKVIH
jgi:Leucine rich repeat/Leucine Rich repeat